MFAEMTRRLATQPGFTVMAALLSLCIALTGLAPSVYATQVMGHYVAHGRIGTLYSMAIGLALALSVELLLRVMRYRLLSVVCVSADGELADALFQRTPQSDRLRTLSLLESVSSTYSSGRMASLMDLPIALLYVAALWWIAPAIGIAGSIAIGLAVSADLAINRVAGVAVTTSNSRRKELALSSTRDATRLSIADWGSEVARVGLVAAFREGFMSLGNSAIYALVITVGAVLVVNTDLAPSALFGTGLLGARAGSIILRTGGMLSDLRRGQPAMEAVVGILRTPDPASRSHGLTSSDARQSPLAAGE